MQQKFLSFLLSALLWAMMTAGAKTALAADNQSITWTWAATANQDKSFTIRATFDKQFTINWGDGSAAETKTGDGDTNIVPSHTYTTAGSYTVTITALSADCDFTCLSSAFQNLITLDVSGAPALRILDCGLNQLTTLDLSQNSALTELFCYNNQLTALDISQSSALITLYCNNNQLTALDLSKNSALTVLQCNRNQLTALDLSKNSALADLDCGYNQLTALDLSKNSALTELYCEINQLTALDVSTNTALTYLECYNNQLTALDVSTNTALINLYCNNNQLTALDVRQNSALTELGCSNNQLTALDVRQNSALTELDCSNNQLTALDVSQNSALITLYCNNNQLTALDVSTNTALINLYCNNNQLTALDVSTNTALINLYCNNNQLTALDVSTSTALSTLWCGNNQLTALDVSTNTALTYLDCYNNQLTALDVSTNTALINLDCYNNQLTALDVSQNSALITLYCDNNQLTALDVSTSTALSTLWCGNNQLTFSTLPLPQYASYIYAPQNTINGGIVSGFVDLSSEYNINDNVTLYTWYEVTGTAELSISPDRYTDHGDGTFTFGSEFNDKTLRCKMTNATFPDFTASDPLVYEVTIGTHVQYTITATAGSNGTITPNGAILVAEGDHQRFIFTANNGYEVDELLVDNVNISDSIAGGSYTFENVTEDHTIEVTFKKKAVEEDQILFTWNADANSEKSFTLRATDGEEFVVDWGDGTTNTYTGNGYINVTITHSYNSTASYFVSVSASTTDGHFTYLNCDNNQLTALDVSGATALTNLYCNNNQLTALDVSGAPALTELSCYNNQLTALDLSQNSALTELSCFNNQLTALDISQNSALTYLDCNNNQLTTLDISQNSALTELYCEINQLTALDVSTNTALSTLWCYNNQLTALDLSQDSALANLDCANNQLTALDLSTNTALSTLWCYNNQLTALDLSQDSALTFFLCNDNQLTALDLSTNTELIELYCFNNQLTALDVSTSTALSTLWCGNNQLTFSTLPLPQYASYIYAPQNTINGGIVSGFVDLSSEYNINGNVTLYTWYEVTGTAELSISPDRYTDHGDGTFTFGSEFNDKPLRCKMTNATFPDFTASDPLVYEVTIGTHVQYTITATAGSNGTITPNGAILVAEGDHQRFIFTADNGYEVYQLLVDDVNVPDSIAGGSYTFENVTEDHTIEVTFKKKAVEEDQILFTWNADANSEKSFTLRATDGEEFVVDWGDGTTNTYTGNGYINVTITHSYNSTASYFVSINASTTDGHFTYLNCYNNQLTALDVSTNTALSTLLCYNNQLTALNLSQNSALTVLYCQENQLTALDLSQNSTLIYLHCYNNQLTALDLSTNTELIELYCFNNQLTALDLSTNTALSTLWCYNNQLTALDVSTSTALSTLWCGNNQLTFSTLPLPQYTSYIYAPQNTINGGIVSGFVDLSSEYNINGNVTLYTWYEVTGTAELSISPDRYTDHGDGTFTFGTDFDTKTLRCKMTNATFPDFTASDPLVYEVTIGTHVQYTITATAGSNGTITPNGAILVDEGDHQRFTFIANNGYEVDELLIDEVNVPDSIAGGSYTFENVTEDHTIEVTFKPIPPATYIITATAGENGTIDPEGEITVIEGDHQTFTFTANNGYEVYQLLIDEVNVPDSIAGGSYTFVDVMEDHTIEVTFKAISPATYIITATAGENGTIDPEGEITVIEGDNQTFTFTANNGYEVYQLLIDEVNVPDSIAGGSYTFVDVMEDHSIEVTFKSIPPTTYTISASAGENGSIDPEGDVVVAEGNSQRFTFTANNGYEVYQLLIDEVNVPDSIAGGSYTFENITEDHSIEVTFKAISVTQYTITATAGSNGTITPNGAILVDEGNSQRFTFTSNNGYEVYQLLIDGVHVPDSIANGSYTFENVIDNHIIAVTFKAVPFSNVELSGCPENGLLANGATCQLQAVVFPDNALNKTVVWRSTNPNTAIVDATGKVTARSTGVTYIIAKVQEGDAADTCHIRVVQPVSGIVLTPAQATLLLGEEKQLMAKILPENATIMDIIWSSSDETAVTVDAHGKITGIAAGEGVITAKTVDGDFEAMCQVTVVNAHAPATGVTVTPKTLAIERGETYQLSAEVKPANASQMVTWSSNNPAVAIVEADGTVTALAAGKATITAKTDNNYSATCAVTVTIPIDSIVVTPDEWTLPLKGAKALKATVYPSDASNKTIKWSSANTALATVSATGVVTAKNTNGVVEIYATNTASGISGICVITVGTGISAAPPMDISEENTTNHIVLYPNPTVGKLKIESGKLRMNAIKVFDITGRVVLEMNHVDNNEAILDLSNYADGVYFINVDGKTTKIVKK